jgi:hypothetical protein
MREVERHDGSLVLSGDFDDHDEIIVEPVLTTFTPINNRLRCACGAALRAWWFAGAAADSVELVCDHCHQTVGYIGIELRAHR